MTATNFYHLKLKLYISASSKFGLNERTTNAINIYDIPTTKNYFKINVTFI